MTCVWALEESLVSQWSGQLPTTLSPAQEAVSLRSHSLKQVFSSSDTPWFGTWSKQLRTTATQGSAVLRRGTRVWMLCFGTRVIWRWFLFQTWLSQNAAVPRKKFETCLNTGFICLSSGCFIDANEKDDYPVACMSWCKSSKRNHKEKTLAEDETSRWTFVHEMI